MSKTLLTIILTVLLAAPALAEKTPNNSTERITNLEAKNAVIYTHDNWSQNPSIVISGCFKNRGYVLERFDIQFTPPSSTPDSYFIRWTARKNGKWQPKNKANAKRAGNFTVVSNWLGTVGAKWNTVSDDPSAKAYVTINSSMHKLATPVGERMKVLIRPVYDGRMGPKARININTYDWHMSKRPHLSNC